MKTRARRFWISLALTASSLFCNQYSLQYSLRAHDLPMRWSSHAVCSSSFDYLVDNCLDARDLSYGSSTSSIWNFQKPKPSLASHDSVYESCPAEAFAESAAATYAANDFDALVSQRALTSLNAKPYSWAGDLTDLCKRDAAINESRVALKPDFGVPPGPDHYVGDTCSFASEFRARQAAAELINSIEERVIAQSLQLAEEANQLSAKDLSDLEMLASNLAEFDSSQHDLCGGAQSEIVALPRKYAPGMDEYLAYDLTAQDAAVHGTYTADAFAEDSLLVTLPAKPFKHGLAARPIDLDWQTSIQDAAPTEQASTWSSYAYAQVVDSFVSMSRTVYQSANSIADRAYSNWVELPRQLTGVQPITAEDVAVVIDSIDMTQCIVSAQSQDLTLISESAYRLATVATRTNGSSLAAVEQLAMQIDIPVAQPEPQLDLFVIYTDTAGNSITVPSSLARAWNRPELDDTTTNLDASIQDAVGQDAGHQDTSSLIGPEAIAELRTYLLSSIAQGLNHLGETCLQTADSFQQWAGLQIAQRSDSADHFGRK